MLKILIAGLVGAGGAALVHEGAESVAKTATTERGFAVHSAESAPEGSRAYLEWVDETFGFVPHLSGVLAESPAVADSYWKLQLNLQKHGTLTPAEDNIVQFSIARENECQYCVAGHTMAGKMFFGSTDEQLAALRAESSLPEPKFNALRDFALAVYESRGRVSESQLDAFLDAGYTRAQAIDVVGNIAAKVITNYTNQLVHTPVDEPLRPLTVGLPFAEDYELVTP